MKMGPRQLALIFGIGTGIIALLIAACRIALGLDDLGIGIIATIIIYILSSALFIVVAKKKWELGYQNAIIMLVSASIISALVYALGYQRVVDAFPDMKNEDEHYVFFGLFMANLIVHVPIDAIAAIFYKR